MNLITVGVFAALCAAALAFENHNHDKVVCYWNSTSFERPGPAKFQIDDLSPALPVCTHLIFGFAGINAQTLEATALHPQTDTRAGSGFYRAVLRLKENYPDLKVCLSIGGNADPYEETHKYLVATRTSEARAKFVNSVVRLLNEYNFDCVDLAWQFPEVQVKKKRGIFGNIAHNVKKVFGYGKFKDTQETEHRDGFTILVRDLKNQLRQKSPVKDLTIAVLPHVNVTAYFDARSLVPNIDAVHLFAFDQKTPDRNPKEADYPAPIYESFGRARNENIDAQVSYWLERGAPGSKVVVGIPTYARAWKLTAESSSSGVPLIDTDGPSAPGHTGIPGLLSYAEVCSRMAGTGTGPLTRVSDPSKKYGSYAFQLYNQQTGADGIWIGFEEPSTAGNKASYVKSKGLGGVAIWDLSLDDFRGTCTSEKFPILRAVKNRL